MHPFRLQHIMIAGLLTLFLSLFCSAALYGQTPAQKKLIEEVNKHYEETRRLVTEIDKEREHPEPIDIDGRRYDVFILDDISLSHLHGPYPKLNVRLYFELLGEESKSPYKFLMATVSKKDVPMHSLYQEYLFVNGELCFAYDHEDCCGETLKYYKSKEDEYIYSEDPDEEISPESIDSFNQNARKLSKLFGAMVSMSEFGI